MRLFTLFVFLFGVLTHVISSAAQANPIKDVLVVAQKEAFLPVKSAVMAAEKLQLKYHSDANVEMADYAPGSGLASPKLLLYQPFYQKNNMLIPALSMAIDVADHFFVSLLQAYMEIFVEKSNSSFAQFLRARGPQVMLDVPAQYKVEAYRNALISFGSNLYSIALQAERSFRKNGSKICGVFEKPHTIFVLWDNNFKDGAAFQGYYYDTKKNDWVVSKYIVGAMDKIRFNQEVLESYWKGNSILDFKNRFCPQP